MMRFKGATLVPRKDEPEIRESAMRMRKMSRVATMKPILVPGISDRAHSRAKKVSLLGAVRKLSCLTCDRRMAEDMRNLQLQTQKLDLQAAGLIMTRLN